MKGVSVKTKINFEKLTKLYDDIYDVRPYKKIKMVSFLLYKGKIVSFGTNSEKTSVKQNYYRKKAIGEDYEYDKRHSEVDCLNKITANVNLKKCELVVISKKNDGSFRLAKPCPICQRAIKDYGIKKVWFTTYENGFKRIEL